jgi:hypothetical protein
MVVSGGQPDDIAQALAESKAAGSLLVNGYAGSAEEGTATLSNGDQITIPFTRPENEELLMDVTLLIDATYAGDQYVLDRMAELVGGTLSDGTSVSGVYNRGRNISRYSVVYTLMNVPGVYDIQELRLKMESDSSYSTSNIIPVDSTVTPIFTPTGNHSITTHTQITTHNN